MFFLRQKGQKEKAAAAKPAAKTVVTKATPSAPIKPYICSRCGGTFANRRGLNVHAGRCR